MTRSNITVRRSDERGHADHGWLDSRFSFSFADYYDPKHMGFRTLRVINEDRIAAGQGFDTHPHRDMEIISYVVEGELQHKDSMGNGSIIPAGCLQRMSAGTGVAHSEFNPSKTTATHLLQIWILPEKKGLAPSYQELKLRETLKPNALNLVAAGKPDGNVLKVHQDIKLYYGSFDKTAETDHTLEKGRGLWLQMIKGAVEVLGTTLQAGDAAAVENERSLRIKSQPGTEFLLFDLK